MEKSTQMVAKCFFETKDSNFIILHQNIASILSKKEILDLTILELIDVNKEPDILCLTETFLESGQEKYVRLENYLMVSSFCRNKKRGGTCILAKKGISCRDITFIKKYATQKTFECCGIELLENRLIIICLYRIPMSDPNIFLTIY